MFNKGDPDQPNPWDCPRRYWVVNSGRNRRILRRTDMVALDSDVIVEAKTSTKPDLLAKWLLRNQRGLDGLREMARQDQERQNNGKHAGGRPTWTGHLWHSPLQARVAIIKAYHDIEQELRDGGQGDAIPTKADVARRLEIPRSTLYWWIKRLRLPWPPR